MPRQRDDSYKQPDEEDVVEGIADDETFIIGHGYGKEAATTLSCELKAAAESLFSEGYAGGILSDQWLEAWAVALAKVADGERFTEDLVIDCFNALDLERGRAG